MVWQVRHLGPAQEAGGWGRPGTPARPRRRRSSRLVCLPQAGHMAAARQGRTQQRHGEAAETGSKLPRWANGLTVTDTATMILFVRNRFRRQTSLILGQNVMFHVWLQYPRYRKRSSSFLRRNVSGNHRSLRRFSGNVQINEKCHRLPQCFNH